MDEATVDTSQDHSNLYEYVRARLNNSVSVKHVNPHLIPLTNTTQTNPFHMFIGQ
jgi:hypothetical protein